MYNIINIFIKYCPINEKKNNDNIKSSAIKIK